MTMSWGGLSLHSFWSWRATVAGACSQWKWPESSHQGGAVGLCVWLRPAALCFAGFLFVFKRNSKMFIPVL